MQPECDYDKFLSKQVAMRGGTVLHKGHLAPASRYSEDIDLVGDEGRSPTRALIHEAALNFIIADPPPRLPPVRLFLHRSAAPLKVV